MARGSFQFQTAANGDLADGPDNVEALRRLWLSRTLIRGADLGPGDSGDFDYGAWHVSCHLAGAGGVRRSADGRMLWLEISYTPETDEYFGSVSVMGPRGCETSRLDSAQGRALLRSSTLLGFVEGNSTGRTSSHGVDDSRDRFNGWRRQDFDRAVDSSSEGGKVWEHWCTLRDIRPSAPIASSVLAAYVSLVAALGDRFAPTVARGRRQYAHPRQLRALVEAGFTSKESALWDAMPSTIPDEAEPQLLEANPCRALEAVATFDWSDPPRYYMFGRRADSWSRSSDVRGDLAGL
jgi:hypothetical protein